MTKLAHRVHVTAPCVGAGGRAGASACLHRGRSTTRRCDPRWSALRWMGRLRCSLGRAGPGELRWFPLPALSAQRSGVRGSGRELHVSEQSLRATHQQSSSKSDARLPASSCAARTPGQRYVSGLLNHWPGGGGRWHHAGWRTQSLDWSPSPSLSPSVFAVPRKEIKWRKFCICWSIPNQFNQNEQGEKLTKIDSNH